MSLSSILDEKKGESSRSTKRCRMRLGDWRWAWGLVLMNALWVSAATPVSSTKRTDLPNPRAVPLDLIGERHREQVRQVLEKPMLAGRGPAESFYCQPQHYTYF